MSGPDDFETETMARIYADQGHYAKAAAIYRRLAARFPGRLDLRKALQAVESRQHEATHEHLSGMLGEWVVLLRKRRELDRLRRLRRLRP
jgi:hypothetical protein